jgi:hypothetical protein
VRVAGPGSGIQLVQRVGCFSWTPTSGFLRDKFADATGYPLLNRPAACQHRACDCYQVNYGQQRVLRDTAQG